MGTETQMVGKITITETLTLPKARKIRQEIQTFFKKNPDGELQIHFGGYTRLRKETSDEIFKKLTEDKKFGKKYLEKIRTYQLHIFDGKIIGESIERGEK